MATGGSNFASSIDDAKPDLAKQLRGHQVAIAELGSLSSSSRPVYQRKGNIYFKTTIQKATAAEQKQFDLAKAKLEKLNASAA